MRELLIYLDGKLNFIQEVFKDRIEIKIFRCNEEQMKNVQSIAEAESLVITNDKGLVVTKLIPAE